MSACAEAFSLFSCSKDPQPWWVNASGKETRATTALGMEIRARVMHGSLLKASDILSKAGISESSEDPGLAIPVEASDDLYGLKMEKVNRREKSRDALATDVLNQTLEGMTVNPVCHVLDTLPMMRTMARMEETRKLGGGNKVSRSGRFSHYFEFYSSIYLKPAQLEAMCNTLLSNDLLV